MTSQDATMILAGGEDAVRSSVTSALAWGAISAKDAERLLRAAGPAPRPSPHIDPALAGVNNAHGNPHPAA